MLFQAARFLRTLSQIANSRSFLQRSFTNFAGTGGFAMLVKDVMTPDVECVSLDTTLQEAARRMKELDVGPLPICGDDDRLAGMITDRDITIRAVAAGLDPTNAKVRDILTPNIIYCYEDQDVSDAAHMMEQNQIRRLVVLNHDK